MSGTVVQWKRTIGGWRRWGIALVGVLAAAPACRRDVRTDGPPAPSGEGSRSVVTSDPQTPTTIELSGCTAVTADSTCILRGDASLRALVGTALEVRFVSARGVLSATLERTFDDARRYALNVTERDGIVSVYDARRADVDGAPLGRFTLKFEPTPGWLEEVNRRGRANDTQGELDILTPKSSGDDPRDALLALQAMAQIELYRGRSEESARLLRIAIEKARSQGRVSDAVDDAFVLSFAACDRGRSCREGERVLDDVADLVPLYADGLARAPYYRSRIASEEGDSRTALRLLREAEQRADRLGLAALSYHVRTVLAHEYDLTGRFEEAIAIRRRQVADPDPGVDACMRLMNENGLAYGLMMTGRDDAPPGDAGGDARSAAKLARLAEARQLLDRGTRSACPDPSPRAVTFGDLADLELLERHATRAEADIAKARALLPEAPLTDALEWLELEGEAALQKRESRRANALFGELKLRAQAALRSDSVWSASYGLGRSEEQMGHEDRALAAYAAAEATIDDDGLRVPIGEGRARLLRRRDKSASAGIHLLLSAGRPREALEWARTSRKRALRSLLAAERVRMLDGDARARWDENVARYRHERELLDEDAGKDWRFPVAELQVRRTMREREERALRAALEELSSVLAQKALRSNDRLEAPREHELFLLFREEEREEVVFVATSRGTRTFSLSKSAAGAGREAWGAALATELRPSLSGIERVRVLAPPALDSFDIQTLLVDGKPLVEIASVEYSLDEAGPTALEPGGGADDTAAQAPSALVVANPLRDLPEAELEGATVANLLRAEGIPASSLVEREATHAHVVAKLEEVTLLHYAGHAAHSGEDGWESALPLASGGHLTVADVLTLKRVPREVVLLGCNAAGGGGDEARDPLGIGQAFLVRGADVVIAPTREVSDEESVQFARALYESYSAGGAVDIAAAARSAIRSLRTNEKGEAIAFRVFRRD